MSQACDINPRVSESEGTKSYGKGDVKYKNDIRVSDSCLQSPLIQIYIGKN